MLKVLLGVALLFCSSVYAGVIAVPESCPAGNQNWQWQETKCYILLASNVQVQQCDTIIRQCYASVTLCNAARNNEIGSGVTDNKDNVLVGSNGQGLNYQTRNAELNACTQTW